MRQRKIEPWREYLKKLTPEQRDTILVKILQHELDELGMDSYIRYREASPPEEDGSVSEECLFWEGNGENVLND